MVRQKENPLPGMQDATTLVRGITLYNDDVNTFDFVIETLIEVCKHDPEQAEQCALTAHFKGKCNIKNGGFHELKPVYEELSFRGLTVSID